ncbi:MAG TPA: hypothetical protein VGD04_10940 [Methylophilus sp.]
MAYILSITFLIISIFSTNTFAEYRYNYRSTNYSPALKFSNGAAACNDAVYRQNLGFGGATPYSLKSYTEPPITDTTNGQAGNCVMTGIPPQAPLTSSVVIAYDRKTDCTPPQKMDTKNHVCYTPDACDPLKGINAGDFKMASQTSLFCTGSCQVKSTFCLTFKDQGPIVGATWCQGVYTGLSCSPATAEPPPNTPEYDCLKAGQSYGQVNGQTVCLPKNSTGAAPSTESQYDQKTTTSTTGSTTTQTQESTQSTREGDTVTTTTTTQNANGTSTQTTETKDAESYCQSNPLAKICDSEEEKGESAFGGSCVTNFTCEGDAIQCAQAREQHNRNCQLFEDETPLTQLGESMVNGTDGANNPANNENRETVDIAGMVEEGANIGGGSFQDKVISMPRGGSITLPFSKINFVMEILGTMLLAGAYINAARIVGVR